MANTSYSQTKFYGGEWSEVAQGAFDEKAYQTALAISRNSVPFGTGAWTRRPGFRNGGYTRKGLPGRLFDFDFKRSSTYTLELTNEHIRAWGRGSIVTGNDHATVVSISSAAPAVVEIDESRAWLGGDHVVFSGLTNEFRELHNRVFEILPVDSTHFSIVDAVTGIVIDGSVLSWSTPDEPITVSRVLDIASPYTDDLWPSVQMVQVPKNAVFLHRSVSIRALEVTSQPDDDEGVAAEFALNSVALLDGPYLDPVEGSYITPQALEGRVACTLSFQTWSSTKQYKLNDYVSVGTVSYQSLLDINQNQNPATTLGVAWKLVRPDAFAGPNGLQATDIGRHVRLFSEPADFDPTVPYAVDSVVKYNKAYYTALRAITANKKSDVPGVRTDSWGLAPASARWTWGRIVGFSAPTPIVTAELTVIGNFSNGARSIDGVTTQNRETGCKRLDTSSGYIGVNFSASPQKIKFGRIYPASDEGFALRGRINITLRAKQTAPSNRSDGVALGTTGVIANTTAPLTITSNDQTTLWNYVWYDIDTTSDEDRLLVSEQQYFSPDEAADTGLEVQILGGPLLYTTTVRTWRLGLFSETTGWPSVGTYHEGRLWLSGAVDNRVDASKSNDPFNFAPTEVDGTVADNSAISYTLNAAGQNPIFWMEPDARGVICGTQADEWIIRASDQNNKITPTSIQAHRHTKIGCADVRPVRTEQTLVLVQTHKRRMLEYFSDVFSGKFSAPDLHEMAKHLTQGGIEEVAYQKELSPLIWARLGNGTIISGAYKRESLMSSQGPKYIGWSPHTLGSGFDVVSLARAASITGTLDTLAIVTEDADGIHRVEFLSNLPEEPHTLFDSTHLDCAIAPTAYTVGANDVTFFGLWPLEGKEVTIFAGGIDLGEYTVSNGQVVVEYFDDDDDVFDQDYVEAFDGAMTALAGFVYKSQGKTLRPVSQQENGFQVGPVTLGTIRRVHNGHMLLYATKGIYVGPSEDKVRPAKLTTPGGSKLSTTALFSGIKKDIALDDTYSTEGQVYWEIERPYPCTVLSIGADFATSK